MGRLKMTINKNLAIKIARQAAEETGFDIDHLSVEYKKIGDNILVKFTRTDNAPGGSPIYLIDGNSGEILEACASQ
jgi:hypothetical protein